MQQKCYWPLDDNNILQFDIYDTCANLPKTAGIYIFAYRKDGDTWKAKYVGQADDFSFCIPRDSNLNKARNNIDIRIHILELDQACDRAEYVEKLIYSLRPIMNILEA